MVCQEAEEEIEKWGRNIEVVGSVVYTSFLVDAVKEFGIEVEKVRNALTLEVLQPKTDIMRFISPCGSVSNYMGSKMVGIKCKTT